MPRTRAPALFLKGTNSGGRGPRNVPRMRDRVHFIHGVGVQSHSSIRRPASPKRPLVGLADSSTLADKERATAATAPPHWRMCFLQQAQHLLGWPPDEYFCRSWDFRWRWLMARATTSLAGTDSPAVPDLSKKIPEMLHTHRHIQHDAQGTLVDQAIFGVTRSLCRACFTADGDSLTRFQSA